MKTCDSKRAALYQLTGVWCVRDDLRDQPVRNSRFYAEDIGNENGDSVYVRCEVFVRRMLCRVSGIFVHVSKQRR